MSADIGAVAAELYGLTAREFTSARDQRAAAARQAGERDLAAAIKRLRRPTASAQLANRLVRERPDDVAELLGVGAAMRDAQAQLAGDELRRLSQEGQRAVAALTRQARHLADESGQALSEAGGRELEETLHAALADPAAAEALQSGCLVTALHYSGFGMVDIADAVAAPRSAPPAKDAPAPAPQRGSTGAADRRRHALEAARAALGEAQGDLAGARKEAGERERQVDKAQRQQERLRQQVGHLTDQLEHLRSQEYAATAAVHDAERALQGAARTVRAAEKRLAQAQHEVDHRQLEMDPRVPQPGPV